MTAGEISSVPMTYAGVRFRSTLEADWAATLDSLNIIWQYEPEAVRLPSGEFYRPDFYLPRIATWLEVKGPHNERLDKTLELAQVAYHWPGCPDGSSEWDGCCEGEYQIVVVGRAPERGLATWDTSTELRLNECANCGEWWWYSDAGTWGCRAHRRHRGGDDDLSGLVMCDSESVPFVRAPRGAA